MVRLPDTTGQLKNAKDVPVKVLRGFFAGIGQLLLAADRFRAEEADREGAEHDEHHGPPAGLDGDHTAHPMTTVEYVRSAAPARPGIRRKRPPAGPRKFQSLDSTNNVRVLTADMPAESSTGDNRPVRQTRRRKAGAHRAAAPARPAAEPPAPEAGLPVPGYEGLSIASLRARLRNLDAAQVKILLEHEEAAANRPDVVRMLERRVAKLEAAPDAARDHR